MNWLKYFMFISLLFFGKFIFAQENTFEKANEAFLNENYPLAIEMYENLIKEAPSMHLHFNVASAYFEAGNIGKSILHYERALKLKPGDKETKHNLRLAYLATQDEFEPLPELGLITFWKKILCSFTLNQWGGFSIAFIWFSIALAIIYRFYKLAILHKLLSLSLIFSITIAFITWQKYSYDNTHKEAIVLGESVFVRSSPSIDAPQQIEVFEGRKITIIDQVDSWIKIKIDAETTAWVEKKYIERI